MAFEVDEDILQDFLVEASEILEQLSEQLVDLEKRPDDKNLLNAIFRGFHTVKGGAGFLSLTELVDVCHGAENLFDMLRNGKRTLSAELMDVILQALDAINVMFAQVQNREEISPASPDLLHDLHELCKPEGQEQLRTASVAAQPEPEPEPIPEPEIIAEVAPAAVNGGGSIDEISADEFERLLDELHGVGKAPTISAAPVLSDSGDITDDEFEALLDQLHGQGQHGGKPDLAPLQSVQKEVDELIDDDEFERLLDELHGRGQGPQHTMAAAEPKTPVAEPRAPAAAAPVTPPKAPVAAKPAPEPAATPAKAAPAKQAAPAESNAVQSDTTVRVDTKTLDVIMNMVGELVLVRNRLVSLGIASNDEEMSKAVANLDVVTADLQGAVMKTRMQPIKKVFGRFPRVVRDLARTLKKEIELVMVGEETDLDKNLVEALADPLVHLVRNSCDHGVEMPDVREKAGKPRQGTITLSASQQGDHILLCIEDDGAGMDPEKLKSIAISRGVLDADSAARMSDNDAYNLIFAPGFSTKSEISDISGRGVGMDVVKTSIVSLNGSVHIDSTWGKGTRLEIKVPLTLAILPTLMVEVGQQTFALPLGCVNEIFHLDLKKANMVDGQLTIIVRDKAIPLFYLHKWLVRGAGRTARQDQGHVVIVQIGTQQVGFVVDNLIGQEEVVIKPLDNLLQGTPGMAGATITSDGGIALILDVPSLLKAYARRH
ncbi:chemotaxis protein CheA [Aeromonas taiwanensis]|uniref:Chemotaxis protein CheA n=1 Tax=Aeromonas taiwanensis TaxID=633417 RepID=A0A5F0K7C8_9GAMM|nr:chemotaxis protein CheA [Aeromonas taiwanensis]TFF72821.1 chemotaxis protein CheA [Aeromonas taiwanensis]TFF73448.1 chemotaxis protein CheA [Aeromonas taiwanensis]TFF76564.1 chemotaxis protein CheA [Aeromonas taiwanensis]